jgi:hypothetical protein
VAIQRWLSDPANEDRRRALVEQLRGWAARAQGAAGATAGRLAREIELRRLSVESWERELIALRRELVPLERGTVQDAALAAYAAKADEAADLVRRTSRPTEVRPRVLAVLAGEAKVVQAERMRPDARRRALDILEAARADCYAAGIEDAP